MITWAQIIVVIMGIFACVITVALCDLTIINEIGKLKEAILKLSTNKRIK